MNHLTGINLELKHNRKQEEEDKDECNVCQDHSKDGPHVKRKTEGSCSVCDVWSVCHSRTCWSSNIRSSGDSTCDSQAAHLLFNLSNGSCDSSTGWDGSRWREPDPHRPLGEPSSSFPGRRSGGNSLVRGPWEANWKKIVFACHKVHTVEGIELNITATEARRGKFNVPFSSVDTWSYTICFDYSLQAVCVSALLIHTTFVFLQNILSVTVSPTSSLTCFHRWKKKKKDLKLTADHKNFLLLWIKHKVWWKCSRFS